MTKYISFPASKVASMIGMNQYAVFSEIFDEMKCKLTDNKYKTLNDEHILDDNELKVLSNILLPNIKLDSSELNIETILHKSCEPSIHSDNTTNIKKNEKKINTLIKKQFPDKNISKLSEYITTNINTMFNLRNFKDISLEPGQAMVNVIPQSDKKIQIHTHTVTEQEWWRIFEKRNGKMHMFFNKKYSKSLVLEKESEERSKRKCPF